MSVSLETQTRIAELRLKAKSPEGLTLEECREAITFLRGERLNMAPTASKPRTAKPSVNVDDLFGELGL